MEEKEKRKKRGLVYLVLGALVLVLSLAGATYAYFSASVNSAGDNITGGTNNISADNLNLNVTRLAFNPNPAPASDGLVPADFGVTPAGMTDTEVNRALSNNCVSNGYTGCHVWKITATSTQTIREANIRLHLGLNNVEDEEDWSYVVYTGTDSAASNVVYKGGIVDRFPNNNSVIDIHSGITVNGLTQNTPVVYYLMVYLNNTNSAQNDGETTGTTDARGTYNGSVTLEALGGEVKVSFSSVGAPSLPEVASTYITSLYNSATKTVVANNNIDYNYDTTNYLMNDRLGGTTVSLDGGNIRYFGNNPNNYVWLGETYTSSYTIPGTITMVGPQFGFNNYEGCAYVLNMLGLPVDYAPVYCTEDTVVPVGSKKLYRVIGVFDGKLKLIPEMPIGEYVFNRKEVNGVYNDWTTSDIMKLLNPGYGSNEDLDSNNDTITVNNSLYWNKGSGYCYTYYDNSTEACDFTDLGLSSSERSKIVQTNWYLGGFPRDSYITDSKEIYWDSAKFGNQLYALERAGNTWNGYVGLMYPSDTRYAVDFRMATTIPRIGITSETAALGMYMLNDWLALGNTSTNGWSWTISPYSGDGYYVWGVDLTGHLNDNSAILSRGGVRPVFHLSSDAVFESGTGSRSDPYVVR